jgi:hypothetical protein
MSLEQNGLSWIRLQLHRLGYTPIPNHGKIPALKGWNASDYAVRHIFPDAKADTPKKLKKWERLFPEAQTTGQRIEGGLAVLDLDVNDRATIAFIFGWLKQNIPDVEARAPCRCSSDGSHKVALFVRLEGEDFVRLGSRKYHRPDESKETYHKVEIFGGRPTRAGKCSRQFAVHGPRSYADDGVTVTSWYEWAEGPTLLDTKLADLPVITKIQALALLDAFEVWAEADAQGWIRIGEIDAEGEAGGIDMFDLDRDSIRFNIWQGEANVDYEELEDMLPVRPDLRVSPLCLPGVDSTTRHDRCSVYWSPRFNCVVIKDWDTAARHYPSDVAPPNSDAFGDLLKQVADQRGWKPTGHNRNWSANHSGDVAPPMPAHDASFTEKIWWLLHSYAWCELENRVIRLFEASDNCRIDRRAFQEKYLAWREETEGPRGGVKVNLATSGWSVSPDRLRIREVQMRPDKTFPIFDENGELFKNTYQRPTHDGSGDIKPWFEFLAHLIPKLDEREWFMDWLAHKYQHPGIPSVAVIMVAADDSGGVQGTGRGMLRSVLSLLFGPRYVRPLSFDVFTGRSPQGVYTDWGAHAILVVVDESKDTIESGRWSEQRAVYERLKEIVDPRAVERTFTVKYQQAFVAKAFATYLVFSNNRDALQIPAGDRRVAALSNGEMMPLEMAERLQTWINQPGNIAELGRFLATRNLSSFNAYLPPVTDAKITMQELSLSDNDAAFEAVRLATRTAIFTGEQIMRAVAFEAGENMHSEGFQRWIKRRLRATTKRCGDLRMPRTYDAGNRHRILHWRDFKGAAPTTFDEAQIRVGATEKALNLVGRTAQIIEWPDKTTE